MKHIVAGCEDAISRQEIRLLTLRGPRYYLSQVIHTKNTCMNLVELYV